MKGASTPPLVVPVPLNTALEMLSSRNKPKRVIAPREKDPGETQKDYGKPRNFWEAENDPEHASVFSISKTRLIRE